MSATNPLQSKLEALLSQIKAESCRHAPSSRRHEHASDEILVAQILEATADIEQQASAGGLDSSAALNLVAVRTLALTQASGVAIGLVVGNEVVCRAAAGTAPDVGARVQLDKGLSGECVRSSKIVRSDDTAQDPRVDPAASAALNLGSAVVVPIHFAGSVIGVFEVFSAEPNAFDDWAVLAISQIAHFIGGVTNATLAPPMAATPPAAAADPGPTAPAESSVVRALRQIALRHGRVALLLLAALVTAVAASYRARDMMRSARAHRRPEVSLRAAPTAVAGQTATAASAVPPDPAIAREDGRIPEATIFPPLERAKGEHNLVPSTPSPTPNLASAQPLPPLTESASAKLRPLQVPPAPPAMAVVQSATQRGRAMAPLMTAPVAAAELTAVSPAPEAKAGNSNFLTWIPRMLKALVPKEQKPAEEKPTPPAADPQPQFAGP